MEFFPQPTNFDSMPVEIESHWPNRLPAPTQSPPTASKLAHELQEIRCLQPLFRVVWSMEQTKTTH